MDELGASVAIGLPMALALGFTFGMGPCLITCFPYLGPVFLGEHGGVRASWRVILPVSSGRLVAYGLAGAGAAWAGGWMGDAMGLPLAHGVLGAATLAMGVGLLLRVWSGHAPCGGHQSASAGLVPGGLFLLGIGMALTPCAPLSAVLVAAAAAAEPGRGLALGMSFGVGAVAVPALVYGLAVAYFGARLRLQLGPWRRAVEIAGPVLLILFGCSDLVRLLVWWL